MKHRWDVICHAPMCLKRLACRHIGLGREDRSDKSSSLAVFGELICLGESGSPEHRLEGLKRLASVEGNGYFAPLDQFHGVLTV